MCNFSIQVRLFLGLGVNLFRDSFFLILSYSLNVDPMWKGYMIGYFSLVQGITQGFLLKPLKRAVAEPVLFTAALCILATAYFASGLTTVSSHSTMLVIAMRFLSVVK